MDLPADHQRIVDELSRLATEVDGLATPLSTGQFHWQPRGEAGGTGATGWSIGQCIDHLTRTNRIYLEPLAKAAERGRVTGRLRRGELRPNLLGRWFIGEIEPPPKRRFKAPLPAMVPPSDGAKDSILADFRRVQASVTAAVQASADLDLRRIRFHNPLLRGWRVFNLATGFLVICAHERRHLAQAGAVRARPDFPAR